jgi:hypothetical protein
MMMDKRDVSRGEDLYLAIYQRVAAKSDYMQPDGYNQLLPEAVTLAAIASVLTAIFDGIKEGVLSKVGEELVDMAKRQLRRLRSEPHTPEHLVVTLSESVQLLENKQICWDEMTALIALELTRKRLSFSLSQQLASEIVADIKAEMTTSND